MTRLAWCAGCMAMQPIDAHWLALWVDGDGDLRITQPELGCDLDYERENTVFACGQGSALRLTERYLTFRSLEAAQDAHLNAAGTDWSRVNVTQP